jgi:hypothetical protein
MAVKTSGPRVTACCLALLGWPLLYVQMLDVKLQGFDALSLMRQDALLIGAGINEQHRHE